MDYCFLAKDTSGETLAVLVIKDRDSRAILARPVSRKGRLREYVVDQAIASIRSFPKTDNEPALLDLRRGRRPPMSRNPTGAQGVDPRLDARPPGADPRGGPARSPRRAPVGGACRGAPRE
eukprot:12342540-Alexandrium_andersonii.AAC.1